MNLPSVWLILSWLTASRSASVSVLNKRAAEILLDNWLEWSPWTTCTESVYCLHGSRQRKRQCQGGKRCVGIEEESEDCPKESCLDQNVLPDIAHAGYHSFIQEECLTSTKYYAKGMYASLIRHNVRKIFPQIKDVIDSGFFNVKVTRRVLPSERTIYKYCFEPKINLTVEEFTSMIFLGRLKFKYTTLYCPLPKPKEAQHVTGIVIAVQDPGELYAVYAQVTAEKGFRSIYYKHMHGPYSDVYALIWD